MKEEYGKELRNILGRNRAWFAGILGGLAALTIAAGLYIRSPSLSLEQKRRLYDYVSPISTLLVGGTSYFFTVKERNELRDLEERVRKDRKK